MHNLLNFKNDLSEANVAHSNIVEFNGKKKPFKMIGLITKGSRPFVINYLGVTDNYYKQGQP